MAEKCTKTSSPVERWIKPYPFAPLNHFTVPFSLTRTPFTVTGNNSSVAFCLSRFVCRKDRNTPSKDRKLESASPPAHVTAATETAPRCLVVCLSATKQLWSRRVELRYPTAWHKKRQPELRSPTGGPADEHQIIAGRFQLASVKLLKRI